MLLQPPNRSPPPSTSLLQPSLHTVSRAVIKNTYLGATFSCVKPHRLPCTQGTSPSFPDLRGSSEQGPSRVSRLSSRGAYRCTVVRAAFPALLASLRPSATELAVSCACSLCPQRRHSLPAQLQHPLPSLCCPGLLPWPRMNGVPLPWVPLSSPPSDTIPVYYNHSFPCL